MKILLLDIETAPNVVHVWRLWKQNVAINQIVAPGYVLCWAAKWLGASDMQFDSVNRSRPKKMFERVHKLISEADVVVHYNGKAFDIPTLNKEFITLGMLPPPPYKQVDLCLTAKREFLFPSNKMEYVARHLKIGEKVEHEGHALWVKCMAGDTEAWKKMERYNKGDVLLLEALYERMKPWIRNHPAHGVYSESSVNVCPACGSAKLQRRGFYRTQVNKYARLQCQGCGTWSREAYGEFNKEQRATIPRPVPQN